MKATSDHVLTAIFCDDIRNEVGNKMSFMGCYQGELFVPSAPIALAKLCVYLTLSTPVARPVRSLVFKVFQDDDQELARIEMPSEVLQNSHSLVEGSTTRVGLNAAVVFSPFLIKQTSILRVLAVTEDGEVVGPRLLVKIQPQIEPSLQSAVEPKQAKPVFKKVSAKKSVVRKPAKKQ